MMTNRENALEALKGKKPEWVPCFYSSCQIIPASASLETPPIGQGPGVDGYGVHQTPTVSAGGMFTPTTSVPPVLTDIARWRETVHFPQYDKIPVAKIAAAESQALHLDPDNFVQDLFCPNGMFERLHFLMGFENAMVAIMTEPEAVYELAGAIADKKIEFAQIAKKYYNPDYFTYLDDFAYLSGLFISLDTFRTLFKPHIRRIVNAVHAEGMIFKMHCCGKMESLIDDFLDLGITAFDPVQVVNDIPTIKKKTLGRAGIMGGLDVQNVIDLEDVTEIEIRKEVRRCIDTYAQDGGYMIYGTSVHMFSPDSYAPNGRMGIISDECAKYGKEFYK